MIKKQSSTRLKKAVAYLRRSTKKKSQDASIKDQRTFINTYAEKHGYVIVREYVDDGISGDDTERRHAFLEMQHQVTSGEFKFILCWDQNRFGRFDLLEAGFYIKPIRDAGVQLVTVTEGPIDWDSYIGRVTYSLKQEAAHDHGVKLSNVVLRGQVEAAKAGSWIGSKPYGYRIVLCGDLKKLEIEDESKIAIVQRVFREFVEGRLSMSAIAMGLTKDRITSPGGYDHWRYDRIREILANPAYLGHTIYNRFSSSKYHSLQNGEITNSGRRGRNPESDWITTLDTHQGIIDKTIFDKAQAILAKGKTGRSRYQPNENPYLFTGLLRCGKCGSAMDAFLDKTKTHRYYECRQRINSRNYTGKESCEGTTIREDKVINALALYIETRVLGEEMSDGLWKLAKKGTLKPEDLPQAFQNLKRLVCGKSTGKKNLANIKGQIDKLDAQINKVKDNLALLDPEFIPGVQSKIHGWQEQREELERQLSHQPTEKDINNTVLDVLWKVICLGTLGKDADRDDIRQVLKEVESITIHTRLTGNGSGRRHKLKRGDVRFSQVGVATGKVSPQHPWF